MYASKQEEEEATEFLNQLNSVMKDKEETSGNEEIRAKQRRNEKIKKARRRAGRGQYVQRGAVDLWETTEETKKNDAEERAEESRARADVKRGEKKKEAVWMRRGRLSQTQQQRREEDRRLFQQREAVGPLGGQEYSYEEDEEESVSGDDFSEVSETEEEKNRPKQQLPPYVERPGGNPFIPKPGPKKRPGPQVPPKKRPGPQVPPMGAQIPGMVEAFEHHSKLEFTEQALEAQQALFKMDPFSKAHAKRLRDSLVRRVIHTQVAGRLLSMRFYYKVRGALGGSELIQLVVPYNIEKELYHAVITHRRLALPSERRDAQERVRTAGDEEEEEDEGGDGRATFEDTKKLLAEDGYSDMYLKMNTMRTQHEDKREPGTAYIDSTTTSFEDAVRQNLVLLVEEIVRMFIETEFSADFRPVLTDEDFEAECTRFLPDAVQSGMTDALHFVNRALLTFNRQVSLWDVVRNSSLQPSFASLTAIMVQKQRSTTVQSTAATQRLLYIRQREAQSRMLESLRGVGVKQVAWSELSQLKSLGNSFQNRLDMWDPETAPSPYARITLT